LKLKATLICALLLVSGATPTAVSAQAPATRNYTITVHQSWGKPSYQVTVLDSAGAPVIEVARVTTAGLRQLGRITGGEMADSAIAKLYALDVWQLASKDADDGTCTAGADGKKVCTNVADATDIQITVKTAGELRTRKYNAPAEFKSAAAIRAQRLIDYVLDLGDTFDG
jgi:hypothetical protein